MTWKPLVAHTTGARNTKGSLKEQKKTTRTHTTGRGGGQHTHASNTLAYRLEGPRPTRHKHHAHTPRYRQDTHTVGRSVLAQVPPLGSGHRAHVGVWVGVVPPGVLCLHVHHTTRTGGGGGGGGGGALRPPGSAAAEPRPVPLLPVGRGHTAGVPSAGIRGRGGRRGGGVVGMGMGVVVVMVHVGRLVGSVAVAVAGAICQEGGSDDGAEPGAAGGTPLGTVLRLDEGWRVFG
jgi:hypothetical protein